MKDAFSNRIGLLTCLGGVKITKGEKRETIISGCNILGYGDVFALLSFDLQTGTPVICNWLKPGKDGSKIRVVAHTRHPRPIKGIKTGGSIDVINNTFADGLLKLSKESYTSGRLTADYDTAERLWRLLFGEQEQ